MATLLDNVVVTKFNFLPLKRTGPGNNLVYVTYGGGGPADIQMPELEVPFEVDDKYNTLRANLSTEEGDPVVTKLKVLEDLVKTVATERAWEWFGRRFKEEEVASEVDNMFKSVMVYDGSGKYLSLKLKCNGETGFFDSKRARVGKEAVTPHSIVRLIVRPAYVHFMVGKDGLKFGLTFLVRQLQVVGTNEKQAGTGEYMFID